MSEDTYNPNKAIHPGVTLADVLGASSMTQSELAERTGLTPKTISEIVQKKNPITPETATKFASVFGTSTGFWNNLERNYQETLIRLKENERLDKEAASLGRFECYKDLVRWGYLPKTSVAREEVSNLLGFFQVSSLDFVKKTHPVAFRQTKNKSFSHESLAAWLRCGEIEAEKIRTKPFEKETLIDNMESLKKLTTIRNDQLQNQLQSICSEIGIAVVFVPYFAKTYVDGATRWLSSDKALIQVSLRGKSSDRFWFTFFHEIGHILKHGKTDEFIEFENDRSDSLTLKENEADEFAKETLIPDSLFKNFLAKKDLSDEAIVNFARDISVSPSIVAGRLKHELYERGYKDAWKRFPRLTKKIEFARK